MLRPHFLRGIGELGRRGFTYDILVFPRHLAALRVLLKKFDNQLFVLDHLAKPYIKRGLRKQWSKDLRSIARHKNVFCKLSGLVTEADWAAWKESDFTPYLETALEAFGAERLMYGSDWPVCLLASSYERQLSVIRRFTKKLSVTEQDQIMGANAAGFYRINQT
jgi:L-fuconolactonase